MAQNTQYKIKSSKLVKQATGENVDYTPKSSIWFPLTPRPKFKGNVEIV